MEGGVWHQAWQSIERDKWSPSQLYEANPIAHHALWAITCDLSRQPLQWTTGEPAGIEAQQFVDAAVKSAFVAGYVVWKTTKSGKLLVAHPDTTTVRCVDGDWQVESVLAPDWDDAEGWNASVMFPPPPHITSPSQWEWASPIISSALLSERVAKMESNWLDRDTHNSAPSTFTTVTGKLKAPKTERARQWYRSNAVDAINLQGNDVEVSDDSFQTLLKNRADLISHLEENATARRNRTRTKRQSYARPQTQEKAKATQRARRVGRNGHSRD